MRTLVHSAHYSACRDAIAVTWRLERAIMGLEDIIARNPSDFPRAGTKRVAKGSDALAGGRLLIWFLERDENYVDLLSVDFTKFD